MKPKIEESEMLCRICEEVVKSSELEEHSRLCSMTHNLGKQQTDCDLRLQKLAKALSDRRNENLRLKKAPSVPFFFPFHFKNCPLLTYCLLANQIDRLPLYDPVDDSKLVEQIAKRFEWLTSPCFVRRFSPLQKKK